MVGGQGEVAGRGQHGAGLGMPAVGRLASAAEGAVAGDAPRGERSEPLTTAEAGAMTERNHVLLKVILGAGIGCMLTVGSASGGVLAQGTAAEEQNLEKKGTTLNGMPAAPKLDEARVQGPGQPVHGPE